MQPVQEVEAAYLSFVEARHRVWEKRQAGLPAPWTDDPIVASRKFTNVFRILDHGTQFIMTDLIDPEVADRDMLMRLFLYRHTGRVEAWLYLSLTVDPPTYTNLPEVLERLKEYRGATRQKKVKTRWSKTETLQMDSERTVFTHAYLVFPQSHVKGTDKLESILDLTKRLFTPGSSQDVVPDFLAAQTQAERFATLRRNKGVGDFMSMQILTDWGYTPHCGVDREDEFVVLGPGARKGALALNTGNPDATFRWALEAIRSSPSCPRLPTGRLPSYMDVQNTLCEFSKYDRYARKPSPQQLYKPAHPGVQLPPVLPEHW